MGCGTGIVVRDDRSLGYSILRDRVGSGIDVMEVEAVLSMEENLVHSSLEFLKVLEKFTLKSKLLACQQFSSRIMTCSQVDMVKAYEENMKVSNLYISQVKRKCGIEVGKNLRVATRRMDCLQGNSTTAATDLELVPSPNLPKNEDSRQPQCPEDKESAIVEALKHFKMNS